MPLLSPPALCLRIHWPLTTGHWPPFFPHSPLPPRRPPGPAGSGPAQTLPRWLLPDTDRPIVKDRTGPDLDERPLYFSMSPNQAIPAAKSSRFPPLVAAQPLTVLSGQEALNASGSMRAWRMAISRKCPSSPCLFCCVGGEQTQESERGHPLS